MNSTEKLRHNGPFVRFWLASTVSDFGTYITTLGISTLILITMSGTPLDQGLVNASRWAPYLLFGLLAGIWVDRFRRRLVLIVGDFGRGIVLVVICVLGVLGIVTVPALAVAMFAFGTLALVSDAAYQSFVPQLVPRSSLVRANARLQQSDTVAQTTGSAVAGGLIALVTAPIALLVDALSHFFSGIVLSTLGQETSNTRPGRSTESMRARIGAGLRWVYRHDRLAPLAWSTHTWFIGSAIVGVAFPAFILVQLELGPLGLGLILGCAGIGSVIGTTASLGLGSRHGTGPVIIAARISESAAIALVAAAALVATHAGAAPLTATAYESPGDWPALLWIVVAVTAIGQFVFGVAMGAEGPLEIGYRQAVTPDSLMARTSATMRSVNRGMIVVGAPLGGAIAALWGAGTSLGVAACVLLLAAIVLGVSRFRTARIELHQLSDEDAAG